VTEHDLSLVDEALLPPQVRALVRLIGLPETFLILEGRGGIPLRVPKSAARAQVLRDLGLSEASIRALVAEMADRTIDVPKPDKVLQQLRDVALRAERQAGASAAEVARRYRLTRRWVVARTAGGRADEGTDTQRDFFLDPLA
jgi:hypothetical protein